MLDFHSKEGKTLCMLLNYTNALPTRELPTTKSHSELRQ